MNKKILQTCVGLNTIVRPFEVPYSDGENVMLRKCSNIDITDAGKPKRRDGVGLSLAQNLGGIHSMFRATGYKVFVEGDALSIRDSVGTVSRLRTVTAGLRMSCTEMAGTVYHTNGVEQGRIIDGVAYPWEMPTGEIVGPNISTVWQGPPLGHLISQFGPHILIAAGPYIFISREFDPFHFHPGEGRLPTGSEAIMIREVTAGLWVSNQQEIYFYAGNSVKELQPIKKHNLPAVMGTDVYVDQNELLPDMPEEQGIIVTTHDGIMLLTHDGQALPLSKKKISIPAGTSGTAMIRGGQYLVNINF